MKPEQKTRIEAWIHQVMEDFTYHDRMNQKRIQIRQELQELKPSPKSDSHEKVR